MDLVDDKMNPLQKQIEEEGKFMGKGEVFVEQRWEVHQYDGKYYAVLREIFLGNRLGPWTRVREIESKDVDQYIK